MIDGFQNATRVPELRRRVLFTLAMLAVYRIGVAIPTPGIDGQALAAFFDQARNTMLGLVNMFSGGALERFSIFALGIMPYISSSIILQLLTVVFPYLEKLSKEGELGRRKITQYTRYGTIVLSIIQGTFISMGLEQHPGSRRRFGRVSSGLGVPRHDRRDADVGYRVHHVARRADHRARHRQRHLADHLRRHRRQLPIRSDHHVSILPGRGDVAVHDDLPGRLHGGRRRRHHLHGARRSPDPGAVRQARRRPKDVRRPELALAFEDQPDRRDPTDLRLVDPDLSGDRSRNSSSTRTRAWSPIC